MSYTDEQISEHLTSMIREATSDNDYQLYQIVDECFARIKVLESAQGATCPCGGNSANAVGADTGGANDHVAAGVGKSGHANGEVSRPQQSGDYEFLNTPAPSEPQIHGVTFLIFRADGHVLLEQCPKKRAVLGVGEWFVPGGKCEPDEMPFQAVRREAREELGIEIYQAEPLPIIEGSLVPPGPKGTFLMRPFIVRAMGGSVPTATIDEGVALRWVPVTEAINSPVLQVRAMVAMAMARYGMDAAPVAGRTGVCLIAGERARQIEEKGYDAAHDDEHGSAEIVSVVQEIVAYVDPTVTLDIEDPWGIIKRTERKFPNEHDSNIRLLTIAGALLAAEIDRLQRLGVKE